MNELKIFENLEFGKVRVIEQTKSNNYVGFVYALEWGNLIKIGSTKNPYERLCALKRQAEKYGNINIGKFVITKEHTNYRENERKLHEYFHNFKKENTELFHITLDVFLAELPNQISFIDDSEKMEHQANGVSDFFKGVLMDVKKTNTKLQIFNNDEFGQIRSLMIDDTIWFVGRDVCHIFGDKNPNRSLGRVDDIDKREEYIIDSLGRNQLAIFVNESGLYSLLFSMKPQKANNSGMSDAYPIEMRHRIEKLHKFKRWVTSEILPSIRKNGGYIENQENLTPEQIVANALVVAQNIIDNQLRQLNEQKPLVEFAETVSKTVNSISVGDFAKLVADQNIKIGQKRLFKWFRENKYLNSDNIPYQKYIESNLFKIIEQTYTTPYGEKTSLKTLITGKGQIYFVEKLRKLFF